MTVLFKKPSIQITVQERLHGKVLKTKSITLKK
jgi:hypothetical protein